LMIMLGCHSMIGESEQVKCEGISQAVEL
jgi:hypothetical protein